MIALTLTAGLVELEMAELETGEKAPILATFTPDEKAVGGPNRRPRKFNGLAKRRTIQN
jgi:hypothetical protein